MALFLIWTVPASCLAPYCSSASLGWKLPILMLWSSTGQADTIGCSSHKLAAVRVSKQLA